MYSIIPVRALQDNYIWLIKGHNGNECICVDPGDATPVIEYCKSYSLNLVTILITHHHYDHTNGIDELFIEYSPRIYAPSNNIHPKATTVLDGADFHLPSIDAKCSVITTPGHTLDHVVYKIDNSLFTGDTLFSAGCGRVFEGTFPMLYDSINKIAKMPDSSNIYCGHEYTKNNLIFANQVEPKNQQVIRKLEEICNTGDNITTLPTTLMQEKLINPFLRCHENDIIESVQNYSNKQLNTATDVFKELRIWKDNFKI